VPLDHQPTIDGLDATRLLEHGANRLTVQMNLFTPSPARTGVRRGVTFAGLFVLCSVGFGATPASAAVARSRAAAPNILYIMSDDHSAQAIGAYGGRLAPLGVTPNLDRLAREGMRLDRVFCGNSICSPSRATILTGQHSQDNGVLELNQPLPPARQALPRAMREAGYATALVGKWHLRDEPAEFDYYKVLPGQGSYFNPTFHEKGRGTFPENVVKDTGHSTDIITESSLAWLKGRDTSKPFFLCLHYKAPHGLWQNAPRYDRYLAEKKIPLPEDPFAPNRHGSIATRGHHDELMPWLGSSVSGRNVLRNLTETFELQAMAKGPPRESWQAAHDAYLKAYLRCVKGIDDNIGRVYDYLKSEGLLDNTLIVYTSDQGMWLGEHDYMDKRWMYEESMRMPLIVRYPPTIKPGTTSSALVGNIDFAPTLIDFAGRTSPASMHGRSIRPILEGEGRTPPGWRRAVYYRYWMHLMGNCVPAHFGVRSDRYKLIFFYGIREDGSGVRTPPGWELYDLENDPREVNNIYDDPANATVVADLKRELLRLREEFNETDRKYPKVQAIIDAHWTTTAASRAEAERISHAAKGAFEIQGKRAISAGGQGGKKAGK
jgi:arylsulfatase A-like enzyme